MRYVDVNSVTIFLDLEQIHRFYIFALIIVEEDAASFNKKLVGIPIIHFCGKYHEVYDVMVMTMIKNTIANEFERLGAFSRETVLMIGAQMVVLNRTFQ